jgi:hypothetical protein
MSAAGKPPPKDPTDSLFDALQAAKERKHAPPSPAKAENADAAVQGVTIDPPQAFPIGKPVLILAAFVFTAVGMIWALTRPSPQSSTDTAAVDKTTAPAEPSAPLRDARPPTPATTLTQNPGIARSALTPANSSELRRRQIEMERDQLLARERAEREERERSERERERDAEVTRNDDQPARGRDWRAQQPEGYVDDASRPPPERPGEEGTVSRLAREQGVRLDEPPPNDEPARDPDPAVER